MVVGCGDRTKISDAPDTIRAVEIAQASGDQSRKANYYLDCFHSYLARLE